MRRDEQSVYWRMGMLSVRLLLEAWKTGVRLVVLLTTAVNRLILDWLNDKRKV